MPDQALTALTESNGVLKKLTWIVRVSILSPLLVALANGVHDAAPALVGTLPWWAAPVVTVVTSAAVTFLSNFAAKQHDAAMVNALAAPSTTVDPLYQQAPK